MNPRFDVVIVGGGPVGTTLAALLADEGASVGVLERDLDVYPLPRAAHVDAETVRTLRQIGAWSDEPGWSVANEGMDFLTADRQLLLRMTSAELGERTVPQSSLFHQPSLDRLIRERATARGATLLLGHEVSRIDESGPVIRLSATDPAGRPVTVEADWVVGCCGARSFTRRHMGTGQIDLQFDEPWLVVDVLLDAPVPDAPRRAWQVCDPARPHTIVPMPWPRRRFEFMLLPGEDPDELNRPAVIEALMAPYLAPGTATVERSAVYRFHGLVATEWRRGRLLLAGDSAHQMPPFLGQGMCSGIRDALNLSWKLAAVRRGADESLLDTYQVERSPHVQSIVESAVGFGRIICTLDPVVAAERDRSMLAARAANPRDVGEAPTPALSGSPLTTESGGYVVSDGRLDGAFFDEVLGSRWAAVVRDETVLDVDDRKLLDRLEARVIVARADTVTERILTNATSDVVIVRPDRIVFGAGRSSLDALRAAVEQFALAAN